MDAQDLERIGTIVCLDSTPRSKAPVAGVYKADLDPNAGKDVDSSLNPSEEGDEVAHLDASRILADLEWKDEEQSAERPDQSTLEDTAKAKQRMRRL